MLFKNLPFFSLFIVIPIRLILDGLAAVIFLKQKNGWQHFFGIIKAHFTFYFSIPILINKRNRITQKNNLIGKIKSSILIQWKLNRIKYFSDLKR